MTRRVLHLRSWRSAAMLTVLLGMPWRAASASVAARPCTVPATSTKTQPFVLALEAVAVSPRDTTAQVRICLLMPAGQKIGSFHLELEYDSTRAIAVRAQPAPSGTQVANTTLAGRVSIAGAAPSGFARGVLSTLTFRRRGPTLGAMRLSVRELNRTDGSSVSARVRVQGLGRWIWSDPTPVAAGQAPELQGVEPARATLVPGGVAEVLVRGRGFTSTGNVVMLGSAVLGELRSSDGNTLRLLVPNSWPSSGEAPPRVIEAGDYTLQIRNTRGLSNAILITLVNP